MLARLKHKLASERGASLSMALMLFLVCSVVASIALTASTASVGRLSRLEDAEKSYYHVTSAASVVWDILQGDDPDAPGLPVEVEYGCEAQWQTGAWEPDDDTWTLSIDGKDVGDRAGKGATLFEIATCDLLFGTKSTLKDGLLIEADAAKNRFLEPDWAAVEPEPLEVTFSARPYDDPSDSVTMAPPGTMKAGYGFGEDDVVRVKVTRNEDRTFTFVFTDSSTDSTSPATYTLVASVDITEDPVEGADGVSDGEERELSWKTTVVWTPLSLSAGGIS